MNSYVLSTLTVKSAEARCRAGTLRRIPALVAGLFAAGAALAQQVPADSSAATGSLEAVVVTAERHKANAQVTPISLSVLSDEALARANVNNLSDLSGYVPGLVVGEKLTGGGNNAITIRGVSGQNVLTGLDGAVSVYLDGVYLSKPDAAFFALADVERVEILRGPQGTLYGRNATAGAVNIITRTPSNTSWQGTVDANMGNYNSYSRRAYAGGPLGGGFAASISVASTGHDGYITNSADGTKVGGIDSDTYRAKLHFQTDDKKLEAILAYDRTRENQDMMVFQYGYGPANAFKWFGLSNPGVTFVDWDNYNYAKHVSDGSNLTLNYNLSDKWTLTSITGNRKMTVDAAYSVTPPGGFPAIGGLGIQSLNHSEYGPSLSQEFRAVYQGDRLKLATGITFFKEDVRSQFGGVVAPLNSPPGDMNKVATAPVVTTNVKSAAAYAQADWEFIDKYTATFGLRANKENRKMFEVFPAIAGQPTLSSEVSDNKLLPKLGLTYKPDERWMVYASRAQGYQAPGQSYVTSPAIPILTVAPEKLISYEVGGKSEWMGGKLRINGAAFHYDYNPLQVRVTTGLNQFKIVNAGAKVDGVELDAAYALTRNWKLTGSVVAMHARYTSSFCDTAIPFDRPLDCQLTGTSGANNGVSRVGDPLNQAPDKQVNLGFSYRLPLNGGRTFTADGSYSFQSEMYFTPGKNVYARAEPIGRTNLRAGLMFANDVELYGFINNLDNKQTQQGMIYTALVGNVLSAGGISPPRTVGAGLRYSF